MLRAAVYSTFFSSSIIYRKNADIFAIDNVAEATRSQ
jgi:hypothetical protein